MYWPVQASISIVTNGLSVAGRYIGGGRDQSAPTVSMEYPHRDPESATNSYPLAEVV